MTTEVQVYDSKPLTASDIKQQVNLLQQVMNAVMKKDQHFGVIPGAGNKPTLLKPGAEKIMATFRLSADPEVEDMSSEGVIRYRVKCNLYTQPHRYFAGSGVGECSSEEEKYKWRSAVSDAEWNATDETERREKFKRDSSVKQVRTNPYDLANTILKMAKKRALVDAVLTATAASDIFTQDIEDMPEEVLGKASTSETAPPESGTITGAIEKVGEQTGKTKQKGTPYTKYTIYVDGWKHHTFHNSHADVAKRTQEHGNQVTIEYKASKFGREIVEIFEKEPVSEDDIPF